ncbi:aminobenzoyl-glutamate utilization protein B [Chitinophaga japonensis]|uniref:Aminobenzoyl-glutamate utilization protein B n=2 Tax=Chitinophaga japonensis TaxID=104662 RepID=A0A562SSH5_CHIJA|nr:aminobenzoyl-glutamate utilization protein B [Chitinophaga japonensis]
MLIMKKNQLFPACMAYLLWCSLPVMAQKQTAALKQTAISDLQSQYDHYKQTALQIWEYAEVGYQEYKSAALLAQTLRSSGFSVDTGVAGIPTAFVATYGSGKPVIGILAEYDALPGLSQQAVPEKKPREGASAGHACGHHLFGTASVAAGIELKKLIEAGKLKGTVKVYGCPAEEGGSGKVYMVRAGLFNDVDAVLHWHPGDRNGVSLGRSMANISAKFRFHGLSAHAAAAPEKGRSALDGVEAMNHMVNMLREHIPSSTRIHYVITSGGKAPNVVPDFAEVYYYVRNRDRDIVRDVFERVVNAAKGAALGTGTTMEYEITGGVYDMLPNRTLALAMHKNLQQVGGVPYTPGEKAFGEKIQATFAYTPPPISKAGTVDTLQAERPGDGGGSTDVADVSWTVPTMGLSAATWVPGTPAHSWQAVAAGGTDIGAKGMMVAAKTIALTGIDLFTDPALIQKARAEFLQAKGPGFQYKALLGDRPPALNYRK